MSIEDLKRCIRNVPDWPVKGIQFKDMTTMWKDARAFQESLSLMIERYQGTKVDKVMGPEARGFIIAAPIAYEIGAGFVPVRKPGKLPWEKIEVSYELEYGVDSLAVHADSIEDGERVLVVDDLLATGGTSRAMIELVRKLGGEVIEVAFLVELTFLKGREKLDASIFSLIQF